MKIAASQLASMREYHFREQTIQHQTLEVIFSPPQSEATLSSQATRAKPITKAASSQALSDSFSPEDKLKILILKKLYYQLTGKELKVTDPQDFIPQEASKEQLSSPSQSDNQEQNSGFSLQYDYYQEKIEQESLSFHTQGIIKTAEGQSIKVDLSLSLSREFTLCASQSETKMC